MNQVYQQNWISLDRKTREHLKNVFNLTESIPREIKNDTIISDGIGNEDLKNCITLEKMCEYIGSKETFGRAWEITLSKVYSELNPPVGIIKKKKSDSNLIL